MGPRILTATRTVTWQPRLWAVCRGVLRPKHQVKFYSDCLLGRQWPPIHYTKRRPVLSLPNGFLENQVTLEGGWIRKMGKSINRSAPRPGPGPGAEVSAGVRPASSPGGTKGRHVKGPRPSCWRMQGHHRPGDIGSLLPTQPWLCKMDARGFFFCPSEQTEKADAPAWEPASG